MLPRLTPRQKAGAAVALALLLWAPQGISTETTPLVTGHSTFYNGETYDKCLASIAGILRSRVMWFNDMVLADRYAGKGTYVYVTENGTLDPTKEKLYSEGVFYDFVDPNGAHWHVEEAFMSEGYEAKLRQPDYDISPGRVGVDVGFEATQDRDYVWIVELSARPIHDQFRGDDPHDVYNFLVLVDTCKFKRTHTETRNITHSGADLSTRRGHLPNATAHQHERHTANIWVGREPLITPIGVDPKGARWTADWVTGYAAGNTTQPSAGGASSGRYPGVEEYYGDG